MLISGVHQHPCKKLSHQWQACNRSKVCHVTTFSFVLYYQHSPSLVNHSLVLISKIGTHLIKLQFSHVTL